MIIIIVIIIVIIVTIPRDSGTESAAFLGGRPRALSATRKINKTDTIDDSITT